MEILEAAFIRKEVDRCITRFPFFICLLLILPIAICAQDVLSNNDGPYVFYTSDSIIVKTITEKWGVPLVVINTYKTSEKQNIPLKIRFSKKRKYNFDVRLQPNIQNEQSVWGQPSKLLALSDIEGQFEALRDLLLTNKVIDKKYNWIFGNGHVVICGDLFDRGLYVPEELWLLYKLEVDAKAKGGYFHIILGNHDIMNLSGDFRYVQPKYFEIAQLMGVDYATLYAENTELGRWLRSKNIIEKIGENLCVHGGISPKLNELQLPIEEINKRSRPFYDQPEINDPNINLVVSPFFEGSTSPFWYRGYFIMPRATQAQVDSTLKLYDCKTIIVGHTIVKSNVASYYHNKVIGIDVNQHAGKHEGALFENGQWYRISTKEKKKPLPQVP